MDLKYEGATRISLHQTEKEPCISDLHPDSELQLLQWPIWAEVSQCRRPSLQAVGEKQSLDGDSAHRQKILGPVPHLKTPRIHPLSDLPFPKGESSTLNQLRNVALPAQAKESPQ